MYLRLGLSLLPQRRGKCVWMGTCYDLDILIRAGGLVVATLFACHLDFAVLREVEQSAAIWAEQK